MIDLQLLFPAALENLDNNLLLAINGAHTPFLDTVMWWLSDKWIWIAFYVMLAAMMFRKVGYKNGITALLFIGLMIAATDMVCSQLIRPVFERLRPANLMNPISQYIHIVNGYRGGTFGFPSCHAANTFALATFLSFVMQNRKFTIAMVIWSLVICYSRIYLGVHYPGDILAGIIVGSALATACYQGYAATLRNASSIKSFLRIGSSNAE